jgi:magnesium transporter
MHPGKGETQEADVTGSKRRTPRRERCREFQGAPPGTLRADPLAAKPVVQVMAYGPTGCIEHAVTDLAVIPGLLKQWDVTWVNVEGLGDVEVVRRLGDLFGLHGLALEDVFSVHHRPKVEEYEGHVFVITRMIDPGFPIQTEQLSIFFGERFVLTFQEGHPGDCLDPIRKRIREGLGRIRASGADYLAYSLLDVVLDGYFPRLDDLSEQIEDLEAEVVTRANPDTVARLHQIRRDLLTIRRVMSPSREVFNALIRDDARLIAETTRIHFRDCYDHAIQILDLVENYREITAGLLDIYLSSVSNRMNQVMTVLTIIATVFIPLTFLVGLYGMNFDTNASPWNMPELRWHWGYPVLLLVMIVIVAVQLILFWRRGWIGKKAKEITRVPGAETREPRK